MSARQRCGCMGSNAPRGQATVCENRNRASAGTAAWVSREVRAPVIRAKDGRLRARLDVIVMVRIVARCVCRRAGYGPPSLVVDCPGLCLSAAIPGLDLMKTGQLLRKRGLWHARARPLPFRREGRCARRLQITEYKRKYQRQGAIRIYTAPVQEHYYTATLSTPRKASVFLLCEPRHEPLDGVLRRR